MVYPIAYFSIHDLEFVLFDLNILVQPTTNENERGVKSESREKHLFEQVKVFLRGGIPNDFARENG